ncbi:mycocerosic acid synthase [Coccidioides immitis RMSCC 2394]|uniref:Mycocerosic acid synthase n=1 Tax=Coccidioides immitis RMSCC 2394 TaxID=404692 RepID=A0A0J6Y781_COCIT|nr:mycocerosic acid synthase [Coccidioides immitis RMSCC 2394]
MVAIEMGWREIENYLIPNITIACDNSPKSITISANIDAVKSVVAAIKKEQPQILARLLQVDKAYHSYHMEEIGDHYQSLIKQVIRKAPISGNILDSEHKTGSKYWQDNLESPV